MHLIIWFQLHIIRRRKVTGRGGSYGCEKSRLPNFLDNRLADGGEVVSVTRRPPITPRKIPGTHFCLRLSRPQGHSAAGRIKSIEKSNDLIGNRTGDLPACSIVPQPTTLPRAPYPASNARVIVNEELESAWNELVLTCLRYFQLSRIFAAGTEEN
jgi:hypothetical protein